MTREARKPEVFQNFLSISHQHTYLPRKIWHIANYNQGLVKNRVWFSDPQ